MGIGEIVSEMMEALTSREKALVFEGKMRDLIRNGRVNERVLRTVKLFFCRFP